MSKQRVLVIINPCSGKGKANKILPSVINRLIEKDYSVDVSYTSKSKDATQFAKKDGYNLIVLMGGDGTLNEAISGLIDSKNCENVVLGYIPMGSTNDFARSMGIPRKWKKALDVITDGDDQKIDICKFNEKYFCYVAAHGIFAETSCSISQKIKNKLGHLAYLLFGVKEVFRKNRYPIKIEVDGKTVEGEYAFLGFGNTKSIGGLLKFKDSLVELSDGLFEVLLVKYPKSLGQLTRVIGKLSKSDWQGEGLDLIHTDQVKVYPQEKMLWSLDGERYEIEDEVSIEILKQIIQIKVK